MPLCWYFETIDGVGSTAGLNPHAMTVAFAEHAGVHRLRRNRLRSATSAGSVVTLSGTPCIGDDPSGLFGYDVALKRGSLAAGSPRSPFRVRSITRAGYVVVEEARRPSLVRSDSPVEVGPRGCGGRYHHYGRCGRWCGQRVRVARYENGAWTMCTVLPTSVACRRCASSVGSTASGDSASNCRSTACCRVRATAPLSPPRATWWWSARPSGTTARRTRRHTATSLARAACSSTTWRRSTATATGCPTTGKIASASIRRIPPTRRSMPTATA